MAPVSGVGHAEKRIRGINIHRTTRPALAVWRHRCLRSHLRLLFSPAFACPVGLSPGGQDVRVPFRTFLSLLVNQPANFVELRYGEVRGNPISRSSATEHPTPPGPPYALLILFRTRVLCTTLWGFLARLTSFWHLSEGLELSA